MRSEWRECGECFSNIPHIPGVSKMGHQSPPPTQPATWHVNMFSLTAPGQTTHNTTSFYYTSVFNLRVFTKEVNVLGIESTHCSISALLELIIHHLVSLNSVSLSG